MKKFYVLFLSFFVACPIWAQVEKVTLDVLLKRNIVNAVKKGAESSVRAAQQAIPSVVTKEMISVPEVLSAGAVSANVPDVAAVPLAKVSALTPKQTLLNTSLLAVSTDLAQQIVRCGQSYVGFPQYDYLRNFYENFSDLPEELKPTLSSYGEFMLKRKYPDIPNAEEIAENALEEVSEYIPSYNALKVALEDAGTVNVIFSSLEHQAELAYPSSQFEGTFVRTFRELETVYADGRINGVSGRSAKQAMEQAENQALNKDTGFYLLKVGEPGKALEDVLVMNLSNLQWSSYKKTLEKLPEMIEE